MSVVGTFTGRAQGATSMRGPRVVTPFRGIVYRQKKAEDQWSPPGGVTFRIQRYREPMNTRVDVLDASGWTRLFGRLDLFERLTEAELGFAPPRSGALVRVGELLRRAQEMKVDPTDLRIFPDEDGYVDVARRDGNATVTVSTDGEGPYEIYFSRVGERTRSLDADSLTTALSTLFNE